MGWWGVVSAESLSGPRAAQIALDLPRSRGENVDVRIVSPQIGLQGRTEGTDNSRGSGV